MKRIIVELANYTPQKVPGRIFFQKIADKAVAVEKLSRLRFIKEKEKKLSVVFVAPRFLNRLSRQIHSRPHKCNELSFAFWNPAGKITHVPGEYLGEIFMVPSSNQAKMRDFFYAQVFIHALLHIFGYNHEGRGLSFRKDERLMKRLEALIFCGLTPISFVNRAKGANSKKQAFLR